MCAANARAPRLKTAVILSWFSTTFVCKLPTAVTPRVRVGGEFGFRSVRADDTRLFLLRIASEKKAHQKLLHIVKPAANASRKCSLFTNDRKVINLYVPYTHTDTKYRRMDHGLVIAILTKYYYQTK